MNNHPVIFKGLSAMNRNSSFKDALDVLKADMSCNIEHDIWVRIGRDIPKLSRFIERVMLTSTVQGFSCVFDNKNPKSNIRILDISNEILALYAFCNDLFALEGLEIFTDMNGKRFGELTEEQRSSLLSGISIAVRQFYVRDKYDMEDFIEMFTKSRL